MIEKIGEPKVEKNDFWVKESCKHPEHNIPTHICLPPGEYKHTCPMCGKSIIFNVPEIAY